MNHKLFLNRDSLITVIFLVLTFQFVALGCSGDSEVVGEASVIPASYKQFQSVEDGERLPAVTVAVLDSWIPAEEALGQSGSVTTMSQFDFVDGSTKISL